MKSKSQRSKGRKRSARSSNKKNQKRQASPNDRNAKRGGGRSRFKSPGAQDRPAISGRPQSQERGGRGRSVHQKLGNKNLEVIQGEVQKNQKGFGFLLRDPEDIFIPATFASNLINGDVVKIWYDAKENEVIRLQIVKRNLKSFIGTYSLEYRNPVVLLEDRMSKEIVLVRGMSGVEKVEHGDKVHVDITQYEPRLEGVIVRNFGPKLAPRFDTLAVVLRSQWPQDFTEKTLEEAKKLSIEIQDAAQANQYQGRKDLRAKPFVTIDGADARDFDDAICVEKTNSGYVLYVAIADVSEFVKPNTKLDEEAYERATSVYFPEWVIPMLPESLSNGACSLRPNEEKLTMTCEMHFDVKGVQHNIKVYNSVIKSQRRWTYEEVNAAWKSGDAFWVEPFELYQLLKLKRQSRGSLDFDLPEAKVQLDESGDTTGIVKVERLDAHRLIEEFMIAANEAVSEFISRDGWPFVFRVHEPPNEEKLEAFSSFAKALGLNPHLGDGNNPKQISKFIESIQGQPLEPILQFLLLRSLKQAYYSSHNLKHFGLASMAYTHFTSPIRRYPDLMVHRILKRFISRKGMNPVQKSEIEAYLFEACAHCSARERKADDLERRVIRVKKARFMAKHLGEVFNSTITKVTDKGMWIELKDWFIDGLVPIAELQSDYFVFNEHKMLLFGKRSGKTYKLGDQISVAVLRTDLENGFVDFTLSENLPPSA